MISLFCGFLLSFMGVYLLMMSKSDFDQESEESRRFQLLSENFAESVLSFAPGPSRRSVHSLDASGALLGKDGEDDDGIELRDFHQLKGEHGS
jgi:hypothetical protein